MQESQGVWVSTATTIGGLVYYSPQGVRVSTATEGTKVDY
jgi:hypothetical protein